MLQNPDPQVENPSRMERTDDVDFTVTPAVLGRLLLGITGILVVAYLIFAINSEILGSEFFGSTILYVLFDLYGEVTVPTWYSSMLLLGCSLVLAAIAVLKLRRRDRYGRHWAGLSIVFLGLSIEESADLHSAVSQQLQSIFNTGGALAYPWVIPAAIFTLIFGLVYLRFLFHLPPATRRQFILAASLYVGGALVVEMIEAAWDSRYGDGIPYLLMVALEEGMEMAGAIVFLVALLSYLGSLASPLRVAIKRR